MDQDVFPWLGKLPLRDIKPAHILDVLRRVEKRSPVQAKLVQTWVGGLCRHAVVSLRMDSDPTAALRRADVIPHERRAEGEELAKDFKDNGSPMGKISLTLQRRP